MSRERVRGRARAGKREGGRELKRAPELEGGRESERGRSRTRKRGRSRNAGRCRARCLGGDAWRPSDGPRRPAHVWVPRLDPGPQEAGYSKAPLKGFPGDRQQAVDPLPKEKAAKDKGVCDTARVTWVDLGGAPPCPGPREPAGPSLAPQARRLQSLALAPGSYKAALLGPPSEPQHPKSSSFAAARRSRSFNPSARCFRCLGRDHFVRHCRDPLRCARCFRTGHRARNCPPRIPPKPAKMQDPGGFRPCAAKAFIPLTEEYRTRHEQCGRAVMVDVIGRSNLGHRPHDTIADDLAARFGGYPSDFLVAGYRERDFVIFLPVWVRPEAVLTNELIHLHHCRLRCFLWDPLRRAASSRLTYKAWIRLLNLPFECWTADRVSAMVCGFARFLQADAQSIELGDMSGFKCLVAVDALSDIPDYLSVSMGDYVVSVPIRIEGTGPFGGEDHGIPLAGGGPREGADQTDPAGRLLARRISFSEEASGDSDSREGCRSGASATWNSSELRDRRRDAAGVDATQPLVHDALALQHLGPWVHAAAAGDVLSVGGADPRLISSENAPPPLSLEPLLPLTLPSGKLPSYVVEGLGCLAEEDSDLQGSFPPLEGPEETRLSSSPISAPDPGRSDPCRALGLASSKVSTLLDSVGPTSVGVPGLDLLGGALLSGLDGDHAAADGLGLLSLGDPVSGAEGALGPGLNSAHSPVITCGSGLPSFQLAGEARGPGWACPFNLRVSFARGQACIVRPPGPLLVISLDWFSPPARLLLPGLFAGLDLFAAPALPPEGLGADPAPACASVFPAGLVGYDVLGPAGGVGLGAVVSTGALVDVPSDEPGYLDLASCPGAVAKLPGVAPAGSPKRGKTLGLRKSPRLALRPETHALTQAMSRKAALRDEPPRATTTMGPGVCVVGQALSPSASPAALPSVNRNLRELSANCGVRLSDAEVNSLACFLQATATM